MKKTDILLLFIAVAVLIGPGCQSGHEARSPSSGAVHREAPFSRGVNLTDYFQKKSPGQIQFSEAMMREDLENIKSLGCDVVRLPIKLHSMTGGAPEYKIDDLFLLFLDTTLDIAEDVGISLIIDNHTFDPAVETDPGIEKPLIKVWAQLARRYRNRSSYIYYEILNEPHGISSAKWGKIQGRVIETIREYDETHTIIVGPADWNSYRSLDKLPVYDDPNLLYTFHFYDPFIFTHQGANWTNPSLEALAGVPFPWDAGDIPDTPGKLKGTWIEGALENYKNEGTVEHVKRLIDIAAEFGRERNEALFCGEFGVFDVNSGPGMRANWYGVVREYLEEQRIAWTIWDYRGSFGFFRKGREDRFEYDLDIPVVENLGLKAPAQLEPDSGPVTEGFTMYDDSLGPDIREASYSAGPSVSYYEETAPARGRFCIKWSKAARYDALRWNFAGTRDFSRLAAAGYVLELKIKSSAADLRFDIRFLNPGRDNGIPWRMGKTIDQSVLDWDGTWQTVRIPLAELEEKGAWKDEWFEPEGAFDWKRVDCFEIVPEHQPLEDRTVYFDDVRITEP